MCARVCPSAPRPRARALAPAGKLAERLPSWADAPLRPQATAELRQLAELVAGRLAADLAAADTEPQPGPASPSAAELSEGTPVGLAVAAPRAAHEGAAAGGYRGPAGPGGGAVAHGTPAAVSAATPGAAVGREGTVAPLPGESLHRPPEDRVVAAQPTPPPPGGGAQPPQPPQPLWQAASSQDVANLAWGLAKAGCVEDEAAWQWLAGAACDALWQGQPREVANLAWSFAAAGRSGGALHVMMWCCLIRHCHQDDCIQR